MIRSGLASLCLLASSLLFFGCSDSDRKNVLPPAGPGFQITTSSLPQTNVGANVSETLTTANGQPPYTWAIVAGNPPTGVNIGPTNGVLSGTVTGSGNFSFTARVTDGTGAQADRALTWASTAPPVQWNAGFTFPDGLVGQSYNFDLTANVNGGTAPLTFQIVSGSLPNGVTMTPAGIMSGPPVATGTSSFNIQVTSAPDPATGGQSQSQLGTSITVN